MDPQVLAALQQLVAEGRKPSVALLKARVAKSVSMHDLITAVQQVKLAPASILSASVAAASERQQPEHQQQAPVEQQTDLILTELRLIREELGWIRQHMEQSNQA